MVSFIEKVLLKQLVIFTTIVNLSFFIKHQSCPTTTTKEHCLACLKVNCCRDHCHCPAPFILLCFGKRGIFTRSPLLWVFETLSFLCYHVDLPRLPY